MYAICFLFLDRIDVNRPAGLIEYYDSPPEADIQIELKNDFNITQLSKSY